MIQVFWVAQLAKNMAADPSLTTELVLNRLGGNKGLKNLSHNARHMMEIARYLSTARPDLYSVAVLIRRDAAEVRRVLNVVRVMQYSHSLPRRQALMKVAVAYGALFKNTLWLYEQSTM